MKPPKFSPGDWSVVDNGSSLTDEDGEWGVLEVVAGDVQVAEFYFTEGDRKDKARALADARMCVASKKMFAALESIAKTYRRGCEAHVLAVAALAKARGGK